MLFAFILVSLPRGRHASRTNDIVIRGPKIHINGIENTQESETPGYSVDDDPFSFRGELVEKRAQKEEVNQRPGINEING